MPIRFPCDHCGGVLSIARRKAYSLVDCPKCGCKQVVPSESKAIQEDLVRPPVATTEKAVAGAKTAVAELTAPAKTKPTREQPLFEREDIEDLLAGHSKKIPTIQPSLPVSPVTTPSTAEIAAGVELLVQKDGWTIPKHYVFIAATAAVFLLMIVFGFGVMTGMLIRK